MNKIRIWKLLTYFCLMNMIFSFFGCASKEPQAQLQSSQAQNSQSQSSEQKGLEQHSGYEGLEQKGSEYESEGLEQQRSEQERDAGKQELKETQESNTELETDMMDLYGSVAVSELDYDSFQSRMTDEEWEGFQQYFPVLKENVEFHYTSFGDGVELNKNKEPLKDGEYLSYERYASEEVTDINRFVESHCENDNIEWNVENIRIFDLDADGVQELIIEWTPVGEILVLHREKEEFYAWEIMYRGFEMLQTNGIYISSGGAGANSWKRISFDNGTWLEEILLEEDWGKFYANGEAVDEDTFLEQLHTFETEEVTRYEPMRCMKGVAKIRNATEDGIMKTYYEMEDGTWNCEGTVYQLRLELRGRMPNAIKDSMFVVLTNNAELTFEAVSKSMFSSSFEDTKIMEGSVLVELR